VRPRPLRDLGLALGFLTVLPIGREWPAEGAPDVVGFYPWVGYLLGAEAALIAWLLGFVSPHAVSTSLVGATLVITAWALTTGLLHWDGLADSADGLWGGRDPAKRLEIMRDTRLGAYGTTVLVLTALLQAATAASVLARGAVWVLVTAPVLARASVSLAAWTLPAAREDGLGVTAVQQPSVYAVVVAALAVFGLLVLGHLTAPRVPFFATLVVGSLAGIFLPRLFARQVGGMTGDLFGATILTVETVVLIAGALLS
jgi:adenosylcobinamide-GDP ribazoletransferase